MDDDNEIFFKDVVLSDDQGCLCLLNLAEGDTKIIWNKKNKAEVDNARETFQKLVVEGKWAAFAVGKIGKKKGEKLVMFDPDMGKVILIPPMAGGGQWQ